MAPKTFHECKDCGEQHADGEVCLPDEDWYEDHEVIWGKVNEATILEGFGITREKWLEMIPALRDAESYINPGRTSYRNHALVEALGIRRKGHALAMLERFPIFKRAKDKEWGREAALSIMKQYSSTAHGKRTKRQEKSSKKKAEQKQTKGKNAKKKQAKRKKTTKEEAEMQEELQEEQEEGMQEDQESSAEEDWTSSEDELEDDYRDDDRPASSTEPGPLEFLYYDSRGFVRRGFNPDPSWKDLRGVLERDWGNDWDVCRLSKNKPKHTRPNRFYSFHVREGQKGLDEARELFNSHYPNAEYFYYSVHSSENDYDNWALGQ